METVPTSTFNDVTNDYREQAVGLPHIEPTSVVDDMEISLDESLIDDPNISINQEDSEENSRTKKKKYNTINIDELVLIAERLSVETSVVTGVANALLACLCKQGFVDADGCQSELIEIPEHLLIDPKKVSRAREKCRSEVNKAFFENLGPIEGIMVDGKHESQRTILKDGKKAQSGCEMKTLSYLNKVL